MTKEEIRTEFIRLVRPIIADAKREFSSAQGFEQLEVLSKKIKNSQSFADKLTASLNRIINESDYDYVNNEKEFDAFIEPTIANLMEEYLSN